MSETLIHISGAAAQQINAAAKRFIGVQANAASDDVQWGNVAADRLRSIVQRIERLEEERKAISSDIKDIYAEAKSAGFDVKALRALISERKKEPDAVAELAALLDTYRRALGDLAETPLGAAALRAVS